MNQKMQQGRSLDAAGIAVRNAPAIMPDNVEAIVSDKHQRTFF